MKKTGILLVLSLLVLTLLPINTSIVRAKDDVAGPDTSGWTDIVYTGKSFTMYDLYPTYNPNLVQIEVEDEDGNLHDGTTYQFKEVGNYYVRIKTLDNTYYIIDPTDGQYMYKGTPLTINKILVDVPQIESDVLAYTGLPQKPKIISGYDTSLMTISGYDEQTEIGDMYFFYFTLIDPDHYKWNDVVSNNPTQIRWAIEFMGEEIDRPELAKKEYDYTGKEISVELEKYNIPEAIILTGDTKATNPGTYSFTVAIADKAKYRWAYGQGDYDAYELKWEIIDTSDEKVSKPYLSDEEFTYDGSEKKVECYYDHGAAYSFSGTLTGTEVGTYTYTAKLNDGYVWEDGSYEDVVMTWKINPKEISKPTLYRSEYVYDDGKEYTIIFNRFNEDYMLLSGTTTASEVGQYQATVSLKDKKNYVWENSDNSDLIFDWKIEDDGVTKESVNIPTLTGNFTYDGSKKTPIETNWNEEAVTKTGKYYAYDAGEYTMTYSLKDTDKYVWEDGTSEDKVFTWTIEKAKLVKPSIKEDEFTYTGNQINIEFDNFNSDALYLSGTRSATEVGSYTYTVSIKNVNYEWEDGTRDDIKGTWSIVEASKTALEIPSLSSFTYDGSEKETVETNFDENLMSREGTLKATYAGEYTVTYSLKDSNLYTWSDGSSEAKTVSWKIEKAKVSIPNVKEDKFTYTGQEITLEFENLDTDLIEAYYINATDAGEYSYQLALKDEANYVWEDGSSEAIEGDYDIEKAKLSKPSLKQDSYAYTGKEISVELVDYDEELVSVEGSVKESKVGEYSLNISIEDTLNYVWEDNSSDSFDLVWKIIETDKTVVEIPNLSNFTYDGSEKETVETYYNEEIISKSGTLKATDVGEYTVTYSLKDTNLYVWSDGSDEDKTVSWKIEVKKLSLVSLKEDEFDYTGEKIQVSYNNFDSSLMSVSGISEEVAYGEYELTVSLNDKKNYCWQDGSANDLTLSWKINPIKSSLSFSASGGNWNGSEEDLLIEANVGDTITIPEAPSREGYEFVYWQGSVYYPGDKYLVEGDHKFTAIWKKVETSQDSKKESAKSENKETVNISTNKKEESKTETKTGSTHAIPNTSVNIKNHVYKIMYFKKEEEMD